MRDAHPVAPSKALARFALVVLSAALLLCASAFVPVRASADAALATSAYVEYSRVFGDIYNGVTTDDGEMLGGSFKLKGRIDYGRVAGVLEYRRDLSNSIVNATTPTGRPGTFLAYPVGGIVVPQFVASDSLFEARAEFRPVQLPVYIGLAYSNASNNYGFPSLQAFGVGIDVATNPRRWISPYGSFYYFPSTSGTFTHSDPNNLASPPFTESFNSNELDVGVSLSLPKTDLSIVAGYDQVTNVHHTGYFNFVRDGPYVGIGYRFK